MKSYGVNKLGVVHLISVLIPEFTLCGVPFEGTSIDDGVDNNSSWVESDIRIVSCSECIKEINNCKNVACQKQ